MKIFISILLNFSFVLVAYNQELKKDTLFFQFDKNYILKTKINSKNLLLKDSSNGGAFQFIIKKEFNKLNNVEIKNLKEFVRNSFFYNSKRKYRKLNDYGLADYLNNYVVILVEISKSKNNFLEVQPITIEN